MHRLPKLLQWVIRKLFNKIPFIELVNSFDYADLESKNEEKISNSIAEKLDELEMNFIDELIPAWTVLIIPLNIFLLISYLNL